MHHSFGRVIIQSRSVLSICGRLGWGERAEEDGVFGQHSALICEMATRAHINLQLMERVLRAVEHIIETWSKSEVPNDECEATAA